MGIFDLLGDARQGQNYCLRGSNDGIMRPVISLFLGQIVSFVDGFGVRSTLTGEILNARYSDIEMQNLITQNSKLLKSKLSGD